MRLHHVVWLLLVLLLLWLLLVGLMLVAVVVVVEAVLLQHEALGGLDEVGAGGFRRLVEFLYRLRITRMHK